MIFHSTGFERFSGFSLSFSVFHFQLCFRRRLSHPFQPFLRKYPLLRIFQNFEMIYVKMLILISIQLLCKFLNQRVYWEDTKDFRSFSSRQPTYYLLHRMNNNEDKSASTEMILRWKNVRRLARHG